MADRIKELKTRALEISKAKSELEGQKRINMRDLSINNELLGIRFEDDSDKSVIKPLSKALTDEQVGIDGRICENQKDIDKTAEEADSSINALNGNISTMETMDKTSRGLAKSEVERQKRDTGKKIDGLKVVKGRLKKTAAVFVATIAGFASGVSVLKNMTEENVVHNEVVPAMHEHLEMNIPTNDREMISDLQRQHPGLKLTLESPPEEKQHSDMQKLGELGAAITDPLNELGGFLKKKDEMDEWANSTTKETRSSGSLD